MQDPALCILNVSHKEVVNTGGLLKFYANGLSCYFLGIVAGLFFIAGLLGWFAVFSCSGTQLYQMYLFCGCIKKMLGKHLQ